MEQDIPAKRSRIDCNPDGDLITSTPQTRGLSNKSVSRVCRKSPNKGMTDQSIEADHNNSHIFHVYSAVL